jgi:hypothetical protein
LPRVVNRGGQIVDEMTLADFNGYRLDGATPPRARRPSRRSPRTCAPRPADPGRRVAPEARPVQRPREGRLARRAPRNGAFVVTYAASNGYVVKLDATSTRAVDQLVASSPNVLAVADYHPAFKLRTELRPPIVVDTNAYDVVVQVIADAEGAAFAESLRARAIAVLASPSRSRLLNFKLRLDGANVLDLARDPPRLRDRARARGDAPRRAPGPDHGRPARRDRHAALGPELLRVARLARLPRRGTPSTSSST